MSTHTIKSNNHHIYQCTQDKKLELLQKIIQDNSTANILVVTANDATPLKEKFKNTNITILEDKELVQAKELECEFLISYDLPIKAIIYMARLNKATKKAIMMLSEEEQKSLHSIETLLGRVIKQEKIEGFEYEVKEKPDFKPQYKKVSKEKIVEIAKQRHQDATQEKPVDPRWEKKDKKPNQFLGKDEKGKAMFSGKSGDRNHRYDGTPRTQYDAPKIIGKKISIKARKPKD